MKKLKAIAVVVTLVMGIALTGCGGSDPKGGNANSASSANNASTDGYTFTSGSTKITMGADASSIVDALGEPKDYFESESCAFEGLDKVYTYAGFKLNTYPVDDKDYVLSVVFMDDTVATDEGISIGSSKDDVTAAYGDPTEDNGSSLIYEKGDTTMTIGMDGDSVATLEIAAKAEK